MLARLYFFFGSAAAEVWWLIRFSFSWVFRDCQQLKQQKSLFHVRRTRKYETAASSVRKWKSNLEWKIYVTAWCLTDPTSDQPDNAPADNMLPIPSALDNRRSCNRKMWHFFFLFESFIRGFTSKVVHKKAIRRSERADEAAKGEDD